jgi:hypothetical protein
MVGVRYRVSSRVDKRTRSVLLLGLPHVQNFEGVLKFMKLWQAVNALSNLSQLSQSLGHGVRRPLYTLPYIYQLLHRSLAMHFTVAHFHSYP